MNRATAEKLKNNPHYRLSAKQKREIAELEAQDEIQYSQPRVHNTTIEKHNILKRRAA